MTVGSIPSSPPEWAEITEPYWTEKPVAIVGNGPSLHGFDLTRLRGRFTVLAVKGAIFQMPWADAGTGMDNPRFNEWRARFETVDFPVYWATNNHKYIGGPPYPPCLRIMQRIDDSSMTDRPTRLHSGGTSGFSAMNVAWLKHAKHIVLFGFDYNGDAKGHTNEDVYTEARQQDESRWIAWARNFSKIKGNLDGAGVRVLNASPNSRIEVFPRMTIEEAIDASNFHWL